MTATTNQGGQGEVQLGKKLKQETAGVRFSRTMFGVTRKLTNQQTEKAADEFDAAPEWLKASKKLVNTRHKAYAQVTEVIRRARGIWIDMTVPYPEPGIRLIRKSRIEELVAAINNCKQELVEKTSALDSEYAAIREEAQVRLGELFNEADYPESLAGEFGMELDFPSIEPPQYLQQLNPELYEQQVKRIQDRFDEAVALAQDAFTQEFASLIGRLTERLTAGEGGKKKVFQESTIENLQEFFGKFQALNVGGNEALEALVEQAKQIVAGKASGELTKELRNDVLLRDQIRAQLTEVEQALKPMLVNRPGRKVNLAVADAADAELAGQQAEDNAAA